MSNSHASRWTRSWGGRRPPARLFLCSVDTPVGVELELSSLRLTSARDIANLSTQYYLQCGCDDLIAAR